MEPSLHISLVCKMNIRVYSVKIAYHLESL